MNDLQNLLQDLKDIHYPDPVSWWPPAIGWDLLALIFILLSIGLFRLGYLHWKKRRWLRTIHRDYAKLLAQYRLNPKDNQVLPELSIWLKRLLFAYFPRENVASLTGEHWLIFLDKASQTHHFTQGVGRLLLTAPYKPSVAQETGEILIEINHLMKKLSKKQPFSLTSSNGGFLRGRIVILSLKLKQKLWRQ